MPVLRPSNGDYTAFVKANATYVAPGSAARSVSRVAQNTFPFSAIGAIARASLVAHRSSPSTSVLNLGVAASVLAIVVAGVAALKGYVTTLLSGINARSICGVKTGGFVIGNDAGAYLQYNNGIDSTVVNIAGNGSRVTANGTGTSAGVYGPISMAELPNGDIVFLDTGVNGAILRRLNPNGYTTNSGTVSFIAGGITSWNDGVGAAAGLLQAQRIGVLPNGNVVVCGTNGSSGISYVDLATSNVVTIASSQQAYAITGLSDGNIAFSPGQQIFIASTATYASNSATVTVLAGNGNNGTQDGTGTNARFAGVQSMRQRQDGNIVVTDGNRIRLVTYPGGVVSTIAGTLTTGSTNAPNGPGTNATFNSPEELGVLTNGNIVIGERSNNDVRLVT